MPATIIQRNKKRLKKVKVDTVSIDIIESALRNARFEMDTVLFRTAMSPGKTWAGAVGGSVCAAVVYGLYLGLLGFAMLPGMALALGLSIIAHGGDLAESAIKRHFGRKDSGSMIPGHGGVLDRIDSTLACSIVLAILVFGAHLNPLFGGHP